MPATDSSARSAAACRRPHSKAGGAGPALHPLPHDRTVLADAGGAAHRAQSPLDRQRRDHRGRHRLRRLHGHHRQERRHDRRGAAAAWLRHRVVRQESQHARLGNQPGRPVRPLAERPGLRLLLRLHGRRHGSVAADAVREPRARAALERSRTTSSRGPRRQGDRVAAGGEGIAPDKPYFLYMSTGRDARAAPGVAAVHRQVQGQVRHGLGRVPRADVRAAEAARRRPGQRRAHEAARADCRPGIRCRPIRSGCSRG